MKFFEEEIVPYQLSKGVAIHTSFQGEQDDRFAAVVCGFEFRALDLRVAVWFGVSFVCMLISAAVYSFG